MAHPPEELSRKKVVASVRAAHAMSERQINGKALQAATDNFVKLHAMGLGVINDETFGFGLLSRKRSARLRELVLSEQEEGPLNLDEQDERRQLVRTLLKNLNQYSNRNHQEMARVFNEINGTAPDEDATGMLDNTEGAPIPDNADPAYDVFCYLFKADIYAVAAELDLSEYGYWIRGTSNRVDHRRSK